MTCTIRSLANLGQVRESAGVDLRARHDVHCPAGTSRCRPHGYVRSQPYRGNDGTNWRGRGYEHGEGCSEAVVHVADIGCHRGNRQNHHTYRLGGVPYRLVATIYCQQILLGMLTIFGPIQWAFSLLPKWEGAWAKWLTRYLTVHFYGAMLYFVGFYVLLLFDIVLCIQVENPTAITTSEQTMAAYLQNSFFSAGYLMAASIVAEMPEPRPRPCGMDDTGG